MIDQERLVKVLSSMKKSDPNAFAELFNLLLKAFESVQTGLLTSNDFVQIRYLQGMGAVLSLFLSVMSQLAKVENTL